MLEKECEFDYNKASRPRKLKQAGGRHLLLRTNPNDRRSPIMSYIHPGEAAYFQAIVRLLLTIKRKLFGPMLPSRNWLFRDILPEAIFI